MGSGALGRTGIGLAYEAGLKLVQLGEGFAQQHGSVEGRLVSAASHRLVSASPLPLLGCPRAPRVDCAAGRLWHSMQVRVRARVRVRVRVDYCGLLRTTVDEP